jgi:hypothetical protein
MEAISSFVIKTSGGLWLHLKKSGYMMAVCSLVVCFSFLFFIYHGKSYNSGH